ncbi:DNA primase [Cupriavidus sp. OV038]|uniref:DNA primase n=1 Tax=unclassified Cupriavidus TaxID=2640874 RepID=UPI0008EB332E|nr:MULTISPECIES: DNA primase [unclassified Cupriavidus]SFB76154.1 DNA primase [Cupriavidus sp. OV038]SFO63995.1 DNA primase [Cupriavidus sp. OV096]
MIPQSFIQDLLNRVDIVDVVGKYVQLKKGGANFMGLCPFHNEKSPSFTVSPTKQFYHCFGCGAHGSAIGFLMEYSGQSYPDAVRELAQSVGVTVPEERDRLPPAQRAEQQAKTVALSDAMTRATEFYRKQLRGAPQAIQYLKGRGLTGEIAANFGLGYAPDDWQGLEAVFGSYRDDNVAAPLVEGGLLIESSEKRDADGKPRRYDRFRDRIMFPIRNTKGNVIGFGGRVMGQGEPKYLNSPETPLFSKGTELYGLFEARHAIRENGYVLVVEGYMDVVALAQLGFANAVATLGTACTTVHVQKLLRQTDAVVFSFDGDSAGRRAARRALEACLPHVADNKTIRFLFLPSEHDPDSYVREEGTDAFARQVQTAMPLSRFLLQVVTEEQDLRQPEGRARAQYEAKPLLQSMPAGGLRLQIVRELADATGTTPAEIEAVCGLGSDSSRVGRFAQPRPRARRQAPTGLEQRVIQLLMSYPSLAGRLDADTRALLLDSTRPEAEVLAHLVDACDGLQGAVNFAAFSEHLAQTPYAEVYAGARTAVLKEEIEEEPATMEFDGAIHKLLAEPLQRELEALQKAVSAGGASDAEKTRMVWLVAEVQRRRQLGLRPATADGA